MKTLENCKFIKKRPVWFAFFKIHVAMLESLNVPVDVHAVL